MTEQPRAVVLLSGGLDSSTVLALAREDGYACTALSFRYGQRHTVELERAAEVARRLGAEHRVVDLNIGAFGGSALTDANLEVPTTATPAGVIPPTYVPGRNTVFIAVGLSLAEAIGAERIYLGINAVDYSGYPDCRPEYLAAFQTLADLASKAGVEGRGAKLTAPLVTLSKVDIVRTALRLGVPIALTWSCYQGGSEPCGVCDACRIRDTALIEAGVPELATPHGRAAGSASR
ncbi:7-cyano-7-deazaguanine synthase QueC (plasmid) [Deinococcus metallilatus]|uniref:7-cyano-7-deazaguanine synthase n=1 Tax=Deinococcus metallilatus TaxID=1211322 RepID=A0AAJ5JZR3_9DEIO|nr:7-cyano-7-deazaguanine synthase QueC [Deinococcus metallilatus]MBB5295655.1 7-cyano-7-deazaguanine synthase [Deinococcus metallilatus]QBY06885.1 7-cyano-7-deazaguanine synthase QueC [Deinococcus metallilatus]TLK32275.1 7-cyano-7-deazaguanine synthase QueC [Deinococcus metallilatus]GMA14185.1 7-cyano-7-deazaguanine synthase [Deinococcus metallilatus]